MNGYEIDVHILYKTKTKMYISKYRFKIQYTYLRYTFIKYK